MQTDRRRTFAACSPHQAEERIGARAMTLKERLKVHDRIERQNREHCEQWRRGIRRKRKQNVRHVVAVRGERGRVA